MIGKREKERYSRSKDTHSDRWLERWREGHCETRGNSRMLTKFYTVAKAIGNRSDRGKITFFKSNISGTHNQI
jgi:hypothetical protein